MSALELHVITRGVPQVMVSSQDIWHHRVFTDDLVILIQGICRSTIRDLAQNHINSINEWCRSKVLKLSELKTNIILCMTKQENSLPATVSFQA